MVLNIYKYIKQKKTINEIFISKHYFDNVHKIQDYKTLYFLN